MEKNKGEINTYIKNFIKVNTKLSENPDCVFLSYKDYKTIEYGVGFTAIKLVSLYEKKYICVYDGDYVWLFYKTSEKAVRKFAHFTKEEERGMFFNQPTGDYKMHRTIWRYHEDYNSRKNVKIFNYFKANIGPNINEL